MHDYTIDTPISELKLSVRSINCLQREGYERLGDLLSLKEEDLYRIRNMGSKCVKEVLDYIHYFDFSKSSNNELDIIGEDNIKHSYRKDQANFNIVELKTKIDNLDLSVRSKNCLLRAGYRSLEDIIDIRQEDLVSIKNLGKKSIKEIKNFIAKVMRRGTFHTMSEVKNQKFFKLGITLKEELALNEIGVKSIFDFMNTKKVDQISIILANKDSQFVDRILECLQKFPFSMKESISTLNLSVRSFNCLMRSGILTLDDLVTIEQSDLLKIKNLGAKSKKEIVNYKSIISYIIDRSDDYSLNFNIDTTKFSFISKWNNLKFLKITKLTKDNCDINSVNDLIKIYNLIKNERELYSLSVQKEILFLVKKLEQICYILESDLDRYLYNEINDLKITSREISILSTRHECTLEELAEKHNLTRERIRQLEKKASEKIQLWYLNSFINNIINVDTLNDCINSEIRLAIYYSLFGSGISSFNINGVPKLYTKSEVEKYDKIAQKIIYAINSGYQPEINLLFRRFLSIDNKVDKNHVDINEENYDNVLTEDDKILVDTLINDIHNITKIEFIANSSIEIKKIVSKRIHSSMKYRTEFFGFFNENLKKFLNRIYNISVSNWMIKLSDKLSEYIREVFRRLVHYEFEKGVLINNNIYLHKTRSIWIMCEDLNIIEYYDRFMNIYSCSSNVDIYLLKSILLENNVKFNIATVTKRNTISKMCVNFMSKYNKMINLSNEDIVDDLNAYFLEWDRHIYSSRGIGNALIASEDVINLDNYRFIVDERFCPIFNDYVDKINADVIINPVFFYKKNQTELHNFNICDLNSLLKLLECILNDKLIKFGQTRYKLSNKLFFDEETRSRIIDELVSMLNEYKNPNYKSIINKLSIDSITQEYLDKYSIESLDEFIDFVECLNSDEIEIYDRRRNNRISDDKDIEIRTNLNNFTEGFSYENYCNILEKVGGQAINLKYEIIDEYYQIEKDKFISKALIVNYDIDEIKEYYLSKINQDYITILDLKELLPIWINPYFAMSILKNEDKNYSPIEQHGKLKLLNPILASRKANIYSLYNLIYLILENDYKGSFRLSAVINYLKHRGIIVQNELPRYFFDLGYGEIINGILVLKSKKKIEYEDEIYDILDNFLRNN